MEVKEGLKIIGIFEKEKDDFNFISLSSKYKISMNEDLQEIYVDNNEDYIAGFYNNNSLVITDMRIIVGENGVGKTRLLNRITSYLDGTNGNCTIIFEKDETLFYCGNLLSEFYQKKKNNSFNQFCIKLNGKDSLFSGNISEIKGMTTIFFSNAMDYTSNNLNRMRVKNEKKLIDISTMSILTNGNLRLMIEKDMYTQISFFLKIRKEKKLDKVLRRYHFNMDKLTVESRPFDQGLFLEFSENSPTVNNMNYILENLSKDETKKNKNKSLIYCLNRSLFQLFFKESGQIAKKVKLFRKHFEVANNNQEFLEKIEFAEDFNEVDKQRLRRLFVEYEKIINCLTAIENLDLYSSSSEISLDESHEEIEKLFNNNNMEFLDLLTSIKFKWKSISAGEIYFLNLFSRLNELKLDNKKYLLIIDEADLGLHPMWQKNWVEIVISILSELFSNSSVQIVLTTHSPLLLSDFRKKDVTLLEKNKKTNKIIMKDCDFDTFASNVHLNLSKTFFLSDGTIGTFSKKIINDIFKKQHDSYYESVVPEIGEPIVKEELKKMLSIDNRERKGTLELEKLLDIVKEKIKTFQDNGNIDE